MRAAFCRDNLSAAVEPEETEHVDGPLRLLLAGRLHYRAPGGGSDAAVALEAYRDAGLAGLARLEGDFALLIADGERRRLVALRDPMGAYPLFWRRTAEGWAIGSSLAGLPGIADAPLDPAWLARRLIGGSASAGGEDSTAFAGVGRLPPGRTASFGFGAGDPLLGPAFDWTARIQSEVVGSPASAAADYRARIEAAVGERLDGGVAAHVSGGMDSSAIALLAARAAGRVDGLALLFDASETLRQEGAFVELVRDRRLHLHRLRGEADFAGWNDIAPHAEPTPWLFRTGQDRDLIAAAARAGVRTILTGEGADEMLAVPPLEILDWALRLRLRRAHREASNWALATGTTAWRVLASLGADRLPFRAAPHPPAWIQPDFARASGWRRGAGREGMAERSRSPGLVLTHLLAQIARMPGDWANETIAHPQRTHIAHPFRDPRVIAFGAAARLKFGADPATKPLLAAAMRGIVPDPILDRRSKASFAPLTYLGIRRHRDALADLIVRAPAEADSIFVRAKLIAALDEAALGISGMAEIQSLAGALGVLKWLELLPAWRSGAREAADSARPEGERSPTECQASGTSSFKAPARIR